MAIAGGGLGGMINEHLYTPAYSVVIFISDLAMSMSKLSIAGELQENIYES